MSTLTLLPADFRLTEEQAIAGQHRMPYGAELQPGGDVRFRLWAPAAEHIEVALQGLQHPLAMEPVGGGWHELVTGEATSGSRYQFRLPDGTRVPDPASRFQPEDVHGPSEVMDPASFSWNDDAWENRPWSEAVLYELHIGTFTEAGTFQAAIGKLDHLVELGVTGIEIMPVAEFPGRWNWGYDGVLLYAPDASYGRPDDLKALVQAAHQRGLMVLLDVVYNHFGPDGNYIPKYAPQLFTNRHKTPWGDAVNYDSAGSPAVRDFIIHNALYWLEEFHFDGLRLDAVHAIKDDGEKHLLEELVERVRAARGKRSVHLILENEDNQVRRLRRNADGEPTQYTAQWNDDLHHVLHTAATLESNGYYKEFVGDTYKLGRALAEGFAFQGEVMGFRGGERGEPSSELPPTAFIAFMQNHDQIGNRAFGERINAIASPEAVHAIAAVYLLLPQIPMLFMGEEWGSSQPFPFFCDFQGELGDLVRKGRREELKHFPEFKDPEKRERIPDPQSENTFRSGKLDWSQRGQAVHAEWLDWYRRILAVRREKIQPLIQGISGYAGTYRVLQTGAVSVRWQVGGGRELALNANLSDRSVSGFGPLQGDPIWKEGPAHVQDLMRPWSVSWTLQTRAT